MATLKLSKPMLPFRSAPGAVVLWHNARRRDSNRCLKEWFGWWANDRSVSVYEVIDGRAVKVCMSGFAVKIGTLSR